MKTKILALTLMVSLSPILGCSLMNPGPGNGGNGGISEWEKMAPIIQSRVRLVAAFAFTMEQVKPHKDAVCQATLLIGEFLNNYDDRDATFATLRAAVMQYLNTLDPSIREPAKIIVDMVLTEAFNYAWQHYENLINLDQTKVVLIVSDAVAQGLTEACRMTLTTMNAKPTLNGIFTVPSGG